MASVLVRIATLIPIAALATALATATTASAATPTPPHVDGIEDPRRVAHEETRAPSVLGTRRDSLIAREDRKRLARPIALPVFGRELRLSGRLTLDHEAQIERLLRFDLELAERADDYARGRRPVDDELDTDQRLELDLFYPFTDDIAIYLAAQAEWRHLVHSDYAQEQSRWTVSRREAWLYWGGLFDTPLAVQVGAQRYSDEREWWWDRDLDSVRLRWDAKRLHVSIGVGEQLLPRDLGRDRIDPEEEEVLRILGEAWWEYWPDHSIALRGLHQDDQSDDYHRLGALCVRPPPFPSPFYTSGCIDRSREDESDAELTWLGGELAGRVKPGALGLVRYWLDGAVVFGRESFYDFAGPDRARGTGRSVLLRNHHEVFGYGLDVGAYWELPLPLRPTLIAGWAFGSGRLGDFQERQRGFRQTGLQDDTDKFGGVATFNYYGELLDPELANLEVWTAGLGFRFLRASSLDLVYHRYAQDELAAYLRDANLRRRPYGRDRDLGDELDVVLGIEEWERFEIKAVFAVFWPGQAFGRGEDRESYLGSLRFRMNF
ncbi:MAG: alginate export family protein [Spirochaetaceae bacterium]|nr:alginate export family protein [Myxococcales bacterium]MCB9723606.1 alginate export family protein [Spirochaetaceae bacterium]